MSFPPIKRARIRKVVRVIFRSKFGKKTFKGTGTITGRSLKEERLSRAKLGKELAESLAVASKQVTDIDARNIIILVEEVLLRVAKEDGGD